MQAWFPTGEPVHGRGSCVLDLAPTGFSKWELGYISYVWNSPLYPISLVSFQITSKEWNHIYLLILLHKLVFHKRKGIKI